MSRTNRRDFLKYAAGAGLSALAAREILLQADARTLARQADDVTAFSGGPGGVTDRDSFASLLSPIGGSGTYLRSDGNIPNWQQILHSELGSVTADQHHARLHANESHSPDMVRVIDVSGTQSSPDILAFRSTTGNQSIVNDGLIPTSTITIDMLLSDELAQLANFSAGNPGVSALPSRGDHKHQITNPLAATLANINNFSNLLGVNPAPARADHRHGLRLTVSTKTANYTILTSDSVILGDATAGAITITLYAASNAGGIIHVKKSDSSVNSVTISRAGTDTIEGAAAIALSAQYNSRTLLAVGNGLWIIVAST